MIILAPLVLAAGASGLGVVAIGGAIGSVGAAMMALQIRATGERRLLQSAAGTVSYWWGWFVAAVVGVNAIGLMLGIYLGWPIVRKYGPYVAALILAPLRTTFGGVELGIQLLTGAKRKRE